MKFTKNIGLLIFIIGFLIFNVTIFIGSYAINSKDIKSHFDTTEETDKNDSIADHFIASAKELNLLKSGKIIIGTNQFMFFNETKQIIDHYNASIGDKWYSDQRVSDQNLQELYNAVQTDQGIKYNEQILNDVFVGQSTKIKSLVDNTNWMFEDQRTYKDIEQFKIDLNSKVLEINQNIGQDFMLKSDSGTLRSLSQSMNLNPANGKFGLMFLLTFGLICIGAIMFLLPDIKLLGPAGIKNNGIYHHALTNQGWIAWALLIYMVSFYLLLYFAPHYLNNVISLVDPISKFLSGNDASEWFLYGFIYCVAMTLMAVRMYIKYRHNNYQLVRTTVVLFFQIAFAFLIPEILMRLNYPYYDFKNAWPLDYDFLFDYNITTLLSSGNMGLFMLVWGLLLTAIIVPLMVYFFGKRWYCSWVCGCGGLAETLGDPYRQNSDKSLKAWKFERYIIHGVLVLATLMTIGTVYSFFHNNPEGYWLTKTHLVVIVNILSVGVMGLVRFGKDEISKISTKSKLYVYSIGGGIILLSIASLTTGNSNALFIDSYTIRTTYGLAIGSIFSGVIGTGFYPIFGNRVWCRFGCPLAAYMGLVQRFKSKFRITTNGGQCISCGNCSTYCEQGIDVRSYAQKGEDIIRASCVGCGVCSAVCPRGVLKLENSNAPKKINDNPLIFENNMVKINPEI